LNSQIPSHNIEDFISECDSDCPKVTVSYDAEKTAKESLNLKTEKDLIGFIGNGGLSNRKFKNTAVQEKSLAGNKGKMIDAYHFKAGRKIFYIAIVYNEQQKKWRIKSLKDDTTLTSPKLRKQLGIK